MNCKQVSQLFSGYVDGELKAHEALLVRQHTHDCEACAIAVRELRIVQSIMKLEPKEVEIPAGLEDRLITKMPKPARKTGLVLAMVSVTAVATLLIPVFSRPQSKKTVENNGSVIVRRVEADQGVLDGADPMAGASLVHYANYRSR